MPEITDEFALTSSYDDIWLVAGVRTPFADYAGVLRDVSPTDLGIFAARSLFARSGIPASAVQTVIAGNVGQSSFDALYVPRHIGLYAGVPLGVPSLGVQRLCGTGFEAILTAADQIALGRAHLALCVGTESMSRFPIAAYTHRAGFRLGQVEFKDFLWECTRDTASKTLMGETAENLAKRYAITREHADRYAAESFTRAARAWTEGFYAGEVESVVNQQWPLAGYEPRSLRLADKAERLERDDHVRPTPYEVLAKLRPAFGGVQTGGNSSAIVDGAAAVLVASGDFVRAQGLKPLARIKAAAVAGVPPEIMGIGPVPAIRAALKQAGLALPDIARIEVNEAFAAQYLAVEAELGLDRARVNVNGGAIAMGHPLAVSGVRLTMAVSRQLNASDGQFAVAAACIGGGQGIAVVLERG